MQALDSNVKLGFQSDPDYVPPAWPQSPPAQQQMLHLDFAVADEQQMEQAVQHAIDCGATKATQQYSPLWTVMIDPAGHPFCFAIE